MRHPYRGRFPHFGSGSYFRGGPRPLLRGILLPEHCIPTFPRQQLRIQHQYRQQRGNQHHHQRGLYQQQQRPSLFHSPASAPVPLLNLPDLNPNSINQPNLSNQNVTLHFQNSNNNAHNKGSGKSEKDSNFQVKEIRKRNLSDSSAANQLPKKSCIEGEEANRLLQPDQNADTVLATITSPINKGNNMQKDTASNLQTSQKPPTIPGKKPVSKCKIHSHKPIPWPTVKREPVDRTDTSIPFDILTKIKQEPGVCGVQETTQIKPTLSIKQEPASSASSSLTTLSLLKGISLKRPINDSITAKGTAKVIKLERNNDVSLRTELSSRKLPTVSIQREIIDITTSPSKTLCPPVPVSSAEAILSAASSASVESLQSKSTFSTVNSISTSSVTSDDSPATVLGDFSSTSDNNNISNHLVSGSDNTVSSNIAAENFLDMIYNDLSQNIPLKMLNAPQSFKKSHILKVFGFCGKVLSYKRQLTHRTSTPGRLITVTSVLI